MLFVISTDNGVHDILVIGVGLESKCSKCHANAIPKQLKHYQGCYILKYEVKIRLQECQTTIILQRDQYSFIKMMAFAFSEWRLLFQSGICFFGKKQMPFWDDR